MTLDQATIAKLTAFHSGVQIRDEKGNVVSVFRPAIRIYEEGEISEVTEEELRLSEQGEKMTTAELLQRLTSAM